MRLVGLLLLGYSAAQVQCPDGFTAPTTYTGYCYKYNTGTLTWNAHENACTQVTLNGQPYAGGHLATIFSAESAQVVMNQYCNNLNQGQSHYFIGYFCISTRYTARTDWRWTSGMPTTWLHNAPTYLSGAEPDDAGCGRAHYSDDGSIPGKIGDWVCSSPLAGGCCEAPVVPTPSASTTATNTPTQTSTQSNTATRTSSSTQTGTQTATQTGTPTQTSSGTSTRTQTQTSTSTRTASSTSTSSSTATATATSTGSSSVSPSESISSSVSTSPSSSPSVTSSPSVSPSGSSSVTATVTKSISMTPPPQRFAALVMVDENGMNVSFVQDEDAIVPPSAINQEVAIIAGGAIAALALLAALCCLWFFCFVVKRRRKEKAARSKLQKINNGVSKRNVTAPSMATVLGIQAAQPARAATFSNVLKSMNPALVKAPRASVAMRNPRMSLALAAYKNTSSFRPTGVRTMKQSLIEEEPAEVQTDNITEHDVIGVVSEEAEEEKLVEDVHEEAEEARVEDTEDETPEDDDYVDEDDAVASGARSRVTGAAVSNSRTLTQKVKNTPDSEASTGMTEQKKLVIGKGALLQEQVQKQTIKLRRVSHVKGDKDITAVRQHRPSARPVSYAFTATVSRTLVKTDT